MVTERRLAGQRILITRPAQQSDQLAQLVEQAGGQAILFAVIDIQLLPVSDWVMPDLATADWLIFVSRNAVKGFISGWQADIPQHLKFAAVGGGTAGVMQAAGLKVDCQPQKSSGSEGLLSMPEMQDVAGCKIIIIRGAGGREHLADTLQSRGASISYTEVYKRDIAVHDAAVREQAMTADKLVCTSVTGVDNLCQLLDEHIDDLLKKPLVVVSDRIKAHAELSGFSHVAVSADASDRAVLQTLIEMDKEHGKQR